MTRASRALAAVEKDVTGYLTSSGLNGVVWKRAAVREMNKCARNYNKGWNGDPRTWKHLPIDMVKDAFIEAARQGYEPGTHCYFVMYGGTDPALNVLTSYQGVFERVNALEGVTMRPPEIVHEKDVFEFSPTHRFDDGTYGPRIKHEPNFLEDSPPIGGYVVWRVGDEYHADYVPRSYIESVKASVAGRGKAGPAWDGPFEEEMWRKTVVQHAKKYIPKGLVMMQGDRIIPGELAEAEDADFEEIDAQAASLGQSAQIEHQTVDAELEEGLRQRTMTQAEQIAERVAAQTPAPSEPEQVEQGAAPAPMEGAGDQPAQGQMLPPAGKGDGQDAEQVTVIAALMRDIKALPGPDQEFVSEMAKRIAASDISEEQKRLAVHALTNQVKALEEGSAD